MIGLLCFALAVLTSPFKSKLRLEAENVVLRHQLNVLRRRLHGRVRLTNNDRWFFIQLFGWFPSILIVLTIIRPETLVHWHRAGFRSYWRWKSRPHGGPPQIDAELRVLIRLWGGHVLAANCSSSGLRSHSLASPSTWSNGGGRPARDGEPSCRTTRRTLPPWTCSLFHGFGLLYAFVIVRLDRGELAWINVTANPMAEWVARQITEAIPWGEVRATSSAIGIGSMAASSRADCARWASETSRPHQPRLGRMALPNS
jgi:hypothetical protein